MSKKIIVIVGGPGTGKTTIINQLISLGYCCYPEISREITLKAQKDGIDQLFTHKPLLFSELLLEGRINQFINAQNENHEVVFIDRGIPDVLAYMDFIGSDYPDFFINACESNRYTKVFLLSPWEDIFVSDNERYENYEQATIIHKHLVETYEKYGYNLVEVPKNEVNKRVDFILSNI